MGLYAKAEWYNPAGSIKDRAALSMILDGERTGRLTRDKVILDATSGNTGIAYAMIGAARGYAVKLCLPKNANQERKRILKAYGAELVLTEPPGGLRRRHPRGAAGLRRVPGAIFLSGSVFQPGQLAGALSRHGAGDLGADGRPDHAFHRRAGDERHFYGHDPPAEGAEPGDSLHLVPAGFAAARPGRHEAHGLGPGAGDLRSLPRR